MTEANQPHATSARAPLPPRPLRPGEVAADPHEGHQEEPDDEHGHEVPPADPLDEHEQEEDAGCDDRKERSATVAPACEHWAGGRR
jgi:hypothetical protein